MVIRRKSTLDTSQGTADIEGSKFKGKVSIDDAVVLVDHIDLPKEVEVEDNSESNGTLVSVQQAGRIEADGRRSRMVKETKNGLEIVFVVKRLLV